MYVCMYVHSYAKKNETNVTIIFAHMSCAVCSLQYTVCSSVVMKTIML